MKRRGFIQMDDGVSEVIGFIIIFGIVMGGIALVTLYGYPALLDAQENANIRNMERNMISIQNDANTLTYKSVPYKETIMQVSDGVFSIENPDSNSYRFRISDSEGDLISYPDPNFPNTFPSGSIRFASNSDEISIALQNGAVVKRQADGSVMLSDPRWFYDEATKTLFINLIQFDSSQAMAKSGIVTIQMTVSPLDINDDDNLIVDKTYAPQDDVTIEYFDTRFEYRKAWENYFDSNGYPPTLTKTCERVIIKAWRIEILNL